MVRIEPYTNAYQQQVIELILGIQINELNVPVTLQDQPDLECIDAIYQQRNGNFWLALVDNKVIGTVALIDIGHSQAALRKMFVAKQYRGEKHGIAKKLLETVLQWCREKNIHDIYLGTVATLYAAHRFYEKNGFQEIKKSLLPKEFPVMAVDTMFYHYHM